VSRYSVGVPDSAQPSGIGPPTTSSIPGYQLASVTTFVGKSLPPGWVVFSGQPSGDPGGRWATNHVTVSNNMLQLNAFQDPRFNNEWVTGGTCECGKPRTYGAFFVRSRLTGYGPTQVEMLWPVAGWPPEVDFEETYGVTTASQATFHYTTQNHQIHKNIHINMTAWHTWGVIWTPTSFIYTVDGRVWGSITDPSIIPHQPMTLHLQQQTWCSAGFACPKSPQSTQVNWIAEYSSTSPEAQSVGTFASVSSALAPSVQASVRRLSQTIAANGYSTVTLTGYVDGAASRARALAVGVGWANSVKQYLNEQLASLNVSNVSINAAGSQSSDASPTNPSRTETGQVFALLK